VTVLLGFIFFFFWLIKLNIYQTEVCIFKSCKYILWNWICLQRLLFFCKRP